MTGDPTTVGYPSKPGAPRQSTEGKIPGIPSLPISYAEALPILKALNGHGPNASTFPSSWHAGGLGYKGVEYNIGPTPESITLHVMNQQEYVITPAWDVIGIINGSISDEVLVIGNHRDAWIAGGAADPNSGSAALNEAIRSFGKALQKGWKPQRTIVFASWDGEEYGLLGSTEWVEDYLPWLNSSAIAYMNIDVGAVGPYFGSSAAPVLNKAILEITDEVQSPNQTVKGQTVRDTWSGHIATMGSGSDFTAFQDFAGVSSIDISFGNSPSVVYHYHSNYDSFHWMDKFGDPGFEYHATMAKIIGLLAAKLVEEPVVSFNATDFAIGLELYLQHTMVSTFNSEWGHTLSRDLFKPLEHAITDFIRTSKNFDYEAAKIRGLLNSQQSSHMREDLFKIVRSTNTKYKLLERQFLYAPGLDSRTWFKHVVFAPGLWTGYAGETYPGLSEAVDSKNETAIRKWVDIIEGAVNKATDLLLSQ